MRRRCPTLLAGRQRSEGEAVEFVDLIGKGTIYDALAAAPYAKVLGEGEEERGSRCPLFRKAVISVDEFRPRTRLGRILNIDPHDRLVQHEPFRLGEELRIGLARAVGEALFFHAVMLKKVGARLFGGAGETLQRAVRQESDALFDEHGKKFAPRDVFPQHENHALFLADRIDDLLHVAGGIGDALPPDLFHFIPPYR